MKKLILYSGLLVSIILLACQSKKNEKGSEGKNIVLIKGIVLNPQVGGNIVLFKHNGNERSVFDTIDFQHDGTFEQTVAVEEIGIYIINFFNRQEKPLILYNEDIYVKADGSKTDGIFEISGSVENDHLKSFQALEEEIAVQTNDMRSLLSTIKTQRALENTYNDFNKKISEKRIALLDKIKGSYISIMLAGQLNPDIYLNEMTETVNILYKKYPQSKAITDFKNQLTSFEKVSIGKKAPELNMKTPDGENLSLSSLKGKIVLIDFWASWCKPCRIENPNVVRVYNRFKDKGFEIFGVSLDRDKENWVKAIEKDELNWLHVSDLQFWGSEAVKIYRVSGIPMTILIDKNGIIIAKNLRGESLEKKLEEILL